MVAKYLLGFTISLAVLAIISIGLEAGYYIGKTEKSLHECPGIWAGTASLFLFIFSLIASIRPNRSRLMLTAGTAAAAFIALFYMFDVSYQLQLYWAYYTGEVFPDENASNIYAMVLCIALFILLQLANVGCIFFLAIDGYVKLGKMTDDRRIFHRRDSRDS